MDAHGHFLQQGTVRLDLLSQRVTVCGAEVELTRAQTLLLARLLRAPDEGVCCDELRAIVGALSHRALQKQVERLRSRLGAAGNQLLFVSAGDKPAYRFASAP